MPNRTNFQAVTILRGIMSVDIPEGGMKQGDKVYLARDGQSNRFRVVRWERARWACSCGQGACEHKLAVNTFLFEESQKRRITGDDLAAHIEDDFLLN